MSKQYFYFKKYYFVLPIIPCITSNSNNSKKAQIPLPKSNAIDLLSAKSTIEREKADSFLWRCLNNSRLLFAE
jgi:hypothetical protein